MIGAATAWLGGITRDVLGAYTSFFIVAGMVAIAAGALALVIRRTPKVQAVGT